MTKKTKGRAGWHQATPKTSNSTRNFTGITSRIEAVFATKARAAAIAADALLALPQWPMGSPETLTDFNDLAAWLAGSDA